MKSPFVGGRRSALLACASLCAILPAHADRTWTGAVDGSWATTGNWLEASLPGATDTVIFNGNSVSNLAIDLAADRTIHGIAIANPVGPVTIQNHTLTVGGGGIDLSAATANLTANSNVTLGVPQEWAIGTGRAVVLNNALTQSPGAAVNFDLASGASIQWTAGPAGALIRRNSTSYATIGNTDFAALDPSGFVVGGAAIEGLYVSNPGGATPTIGGVATVLDFTDDSSYGARLGGNQFINAMRFNQQHGTNPQWTFDLAAGNRTITTSAVLVTENVGPNHVVYNNGFFRISNTTNELMVFQHNTGGDLIINSNISQQGTGAIIKLGAGRMIVQSAGHTGPTRILEGTLQIGNAADILGWNAASAVTNNAHLAFNGTNEFEFASPISGPGDVTQAGTGSISLTAANTYTGDTHVLAGSIGASSTDNFGTGGSIRLNGGGVKFLSAFDLSTRNVLIGENGATFDSNGQTVTLANPVGSGSGGAVTIAGAGSGWLALAAANTYSGGTTVAAGTLLAANTTGSATGSGAVTVQSGARLGGTGTISGAVTVEAGGKIAPGASVGTLTVGGLNLVPGSALDIEFGSSNDRIVVANPGGLIIGGGALTLLHEGSSAVFAGPGTYQLFQYSGAIGGAGVSALSVANPQPGYTYSFGSSGGFVTLTIGTSGTVSYWNTDGGGSWNAAGNWTGGIPNGVGATANFQVALSAPATVTLDGTRTVGSITFLSGGSGYTLAAGSGGSLVLNNGANPSAIVDSGGIHTISAPVTLTTNTILNTERAGDSITLGGVVSGSATFTKIGPGSLSLLASNTLTGAVTLSGGSTTFASGGLGSGSLTVDGATLAWAPGNTQDISNRSIAFGDEAVTLDTGANDVLLANPFGGFGEAGFVKQGEGRLTLAGDTEFFGDVTIAAGTLQLGNNGATGSVFGDIVNEGTLELKLASGAFVPNVISGAGNLVHSGAGVTDLTAANTFTGTTSIASGTLALMNPQALQNSTLLYPNAGGTLDISTLFSVTLGALDGAKDIALSDAFDGPIALTVGGNGASTTYGGVLSGAGSLTKLGGGEMILTGVHAYTGSTTINGGTLQLAGGSIDTTTANIGVGGRLHVTGGSLTSSAFSTFQNGGIAVTLDAGSLAFNGGVQSSQNDGSLLEIWGGQFSALNVILRRTLNYNTGDNPSPAEAGNSGLVINGGTATITDTLQVGTANSGASALVNGGDLSVGGAVTVGNTTNSRWSILEVRSGTFVSTDATQGIVLSPHATSANRALFLVSGSGVATVERIGFGAEASAAGSIGRITLTGAGTLYVGAGGLVQPAAELTSQIQLFGGTLAAKADWSTDLPVETAGFFEIRTADAANASRNIVLSGPVTGTGSLIKSGSGTLSLAGGYSYTGSTIVDEGILQLDGATLSNEGEVEVSTGGKLHLNHNATDTVLRFVVNGISQGAGLFDSITHPEFISGDGKLLVTEGDAFEQWIDSFASLADPADREKGADPDGDGLTNLEEFALDSDPTSGAAGGKVRARIETVGGSPALVITLPVRKGASFGGAPAKTAARDGVIYTIRGTNDLANFDQGVSEIPASTGGLPALSDEEGWEYRSFRLDGAIGTRGPKGFLDVVIGEEP